MADPVVPNSDPKIDFPKPDQPVGHYFPLQTPPPDPGTFEIGLVLGGTVSAAAYTAGVVDFLIQALDAWTLAKNAGGAPTHNVIIRIFAGTSGGALTSVLLARILCSGFPHVDATTPAATRALNPLYDCWVNQVDITDMLATTDLTGKTVPSLLCADKLDAVGDRIADYTPIPLGPASNTPAVRDYVEQKLPIVLTLTNLRGVPYSADFRGTSGRAEYYSNYADHVRLKADITGKNPPTAADLAPYEIGIADAPAAGCQGWATAIHAARGSSAFPVGLPPQRIERDPRHYRYRYAVLDDIDPTAPPSVEWLRPSWPFMIPVGDGPATPYAFLTVDGGCFNNEPTEFARQWLAGVTAHNERDGTKAHRAVLLVDPFAAVPGVGAMTDNGLLDTALSTVGAFTKGTRFETADLDLYTAEDLYSRFLVNPVRKATLPGDSAPTVLTGGAAIATNPLGAFGGFLSSHFREHDFLLGRRNCQEFLRTEFVLPETNSLFDAPRWTPGQRDDYREDGCLPIVPLIGALKTEIPQPPWPKGAFQPESIRGAIKARLSKLADVAMKSSLGALSGPVAWVLGPVISTITDKAVDAIKSALSAKGVDLL
ncbi:MAG: patatin-like phospholipase family protein [Rhizomicrobium sp.]